MLNEKILSSILVSEIRELRVKHPQLIAEDKPILEVLEEGLNINQTRNLYVTGADLTLLGVIRSRNILYYLFPLTAIAGKTWENSRAMPALGAMKAGDIMDREVPCVYDTSNLREVVQIFLREGILELPVVDKDRRIIGQIDASEIVMCHLLKNKKALQER